MSSTSRSTTLDNHPPPSPKNPPSKRARVQQGVQTSGTSGARPGEATSARPSGATSGRAGGPISATAQARAACAGYNNLFGRDSSVLPGSSPEPSECGSSPVPRGILLALHPPKRQHSTMPREGRAAYFESVGAGPRRRREARVPPQRVRLTPRGECSGLVLVLCGACVSAARAAMDTRGTTHLSQDQIFQQRIPHALSSRPRASRAPNLSISLPSPTPSPGAPSPSPALTSLALMSWSKTLPSSGSGRASTARAVYRASVDDVASSNHYSVAFIASGSSLFRQLPSIEA